MKSKIILFSLLISFISCTEKDPNVVSIGLLNGPSSIGMVKSIDNTNYHEGKQIHYKIKDNPQHLRALLQSGNLDMAILPMTMVYSMIENNVDISIFAITGWGNLYLMGRDDINSLMELTGKSISVPGEGQTPDLVTNFLLEKNMIKDKVHINYTYTAPLLLASALAVGKIEYAVLPEPLASLALSKDSTLMRSLDLAEVWDESLPNIPLIQSVFVVDNDFYRKNTPWFNTFTPILKKNSIDVRNKPFEALELAVKHKLLPPQLLVGDIVTNSKLDYEDAEDMPGQLLKYLEVFTELSDSFLIEEHVITR